jgi:integrase
MIGNITRRGKTSWRLKFEAGERDPMTGKRRIRFVTVRGTKKDAQRELTRLLAEIDNGTALDPSKLTLAVYLREWLDGNHGLTPKSAERYSQVVKYQINPHLGAALLQRIRPAQIEAWHATLLREGGYEGRALATHTVAHAHRVLHRGLQRAMKLELVARNVASAVSPPKIEAEEVQILTAEQMAEVLARIAGHPLHPIVALALGTGMRRGEICALAWGAVDLEAGLARVERSLEQTAAGLRFKAPKSRHGHRAVSLPANVVEIMRDHRRQQLEQRLLLGVGRPGSDDLVFTHAEGGAYPPDSLSRAFSRLMESRNLPPIHFHGLRHSHASALIAAGLDVVSVSRRLGHGSPAITLNVYAHQFTTKDAAAAGAIEAAMRGGSAGPKP